MMDGRLEEYDNLLQATRDTIAMVGDKDIREQAAVKAQERELRNLSRLRSVVDTFDPTGTLGRATSDAAQAALNENLEIRARYQLERDAIENIQMAAALGKGAEAQMMANNFTLKNAANVRADYLTKNAVIQAKIDETKAHIDSRWAAVNVVEMLLSGSIPLRQSMGRTGNIDIPKAMENFWDNVLSGQRVNRESEAFDQMSAAELVLKLDDIVANVEDNSRILWWDTPTDRLNIYSSLLDSPSALETNAWDVLANVGIFASAGKLALSVPGTLSRAGARKAAVSSLQKAADDILTKGPTAASSTGMGMNTMEVAAALTPSSNAPFGQASAVSLGLEAVEGMEEGRKMAEALLRLEEAARLNPNELEDAVKAIENLGKKRTGHAVIDVEVLDTPNSVPGLGSKQVAFTIDKAFDSPEAAREYLETIGFGNGEIVQKGASATKEPPLAPGMVRLYHGGILQKPGEGGYGKFGRWVSTNKTYAENYRQGSPLNYVDVPETDPRINNADWPDQGIKQGFTFNFETTPEEALKLKPYYSGPNVGDAVKDTSGLFYPRAIVDMPEAGFISNPLHVHGNNSVVAWLLGARQIEDPGMFALARQSGNKTSNIMSNATMYLQERLKGVKAWEKESVSQVWKIGENKGVWWNREQYDELMQRAYNRGATDNEWKTYNTLRQFNDFEYYLRNSVMYNDKVVRGVRSVSFNTTQVPSKKGFRGIILDRINAFVDNNMTTKPRTVTYNLSTGQAFTKGGVISDKEWAALKEQGYKLISVEGNGVEINGWTFKTLLAKASDLIDENLRFDQLQYRAGGHRMYENPHFIKQTRWITQPDGTKSLVNPLTIANPATPAEAKMMADRLNEALRLVRDEAADAETLDALFKNIGGLNGEEFLENIAKGRIDKDEVFEALYNREKPSKYSEYKDVLQYVDEDASGFNGFLEDTGRMYYSKKGDHLPDFYGNNAPTLDAFESINTALSNVARLVGWNEYRMASVERWVTSARKYLNTEDLRGDLSPYRIFQDGVFRDDSLSATVRDGLEAQRQIIKRNLGWKTPADLSSERLGRQLVEWVNGSDTAGIRNEAAKAVAWATTKDPLQYLKGWAYDLKLGFFNPGQLILQSSTMFSTMALSPKFGMQSMQAMPFMRALAYKNFDKNFVETFGNKHWKTAGFDSADEFKEFIDDFARSGTDKVKNTNQLIGDHGSHAAMDGFTTGVARLRENGRMFLNMAEEMNQSVAYGIAWREARGQKFASKAERNAYVAMRGEDYSLSMKRESAASWQRGVMSIPTQFWAYNMRMMEALVGKQFNNSQKARLLLMQFGLSGAYGVPVVGLFAEGYKALTGDAPDPGTGWALLERGFIDAGVYYMSGADIEIGRRIGTGSFLTDQVKELFGLSQFGPTSVAEFLGGPTYSIGSGVLGSLGAVAKYAMAESGSEEMPLTEAALIKVAGEISTVGNALKGLMILQYGTLITSKGSTVLSDLPPINGVAQMFGFRPGQLNALEAASMNQKGRQKAILDASKVIMNYRTRWVNEPDNREDIEQQINTFVRLLPEDIKQDALKRSQKDVDSSIYETYVERMEKQRAEQEAREETDATNR
jgi:hypothetical protein